ncbi:YrhB domain-containing protein [Sphingomonas sp. 22176]|uniref:YrhB domain-containing protein n=1 Tax=Sphingomonas sp. 22176 TaxID=3453884 RepID=UPI003F85BFE8
MDEQAAIRAFQDFLSRKSAAIGEALAPTLLPPKRLSAGWAFHYQAQSYIEQGDLGALLVGHGAVIVADDGRIIESGSSDRDLEALL